MTRRILAAFVAAAVVSGALAAPVSRAFTYQGVLTVGGVPANGVYDFIVNAYGQSAGGAILATRVISGVQITDGLSNTLIEFEGTDPFNGEARWLEIGIRPGGSADPYTMLSPRQPITPVPYALHALNTHWNKPSPDRISNNDVQYVLINRTNRIGSEWFGVHAPATGNNYGGMYISTESATARPFYGYTTGTESAWTYLDGATGDWHVYNDGTRMTVQKNGNVGIGYATPAARLEVRISEDSQNAIVGRATGAFSYGVQGVGLSAGVRGESGSSGGSGVNGVNNAVQGAGVRGDSTNGAGVAAYTTGGTGVYGQTNSTGYGIFGSNGGSNTTGYAGWFNGRVNVAGTLSKSGGSFKIDHPLDPENMYLSHSFVESPDMMNIYNGVVWLDRDGEALVELPEWFEALNGDYRYQLTAIGAPAPNLYIAREVEGNTFAIAGGQPGMKVSWQVTGVRRDAWAEHNRIPVEEQKRADERGRFLYPEGFGFGVERSVAVPHGE